MVAHSGSQSRIDAGTQRARIERNPESRRATTQGSRFLYEELASAVKQLRALCRGDQSGGMREVGEKIHAVRHPLDMHNALEESRVHRWAALLLNPPEQLALNENIRLELENIPQRFRKPDEDG